VAKIRNFAIKETRSKSHKQRAQGQPLFLTGEISPNIEKLKIKKSKMK
jgi:hypothetical protein